MFTTNSLPHRYIDTVARLCHDGKLFRDQVQNCSLEPTYFLQSAYSAIKPKF